MANISNIIETFLIEMLGNDNSINISRNELANYFACAPSQINYVLATRFTLDKGYIIESRRGGGGYVNVIRIVDTRSDLLTRLANLNVNEGLTYNRAVQILGRLCESEILTESEAELLCAVVSDKALVAPTILKDGLRTGIIKNLAVSLLKKQL